MNSFLDSNVIIGYIFCLDSLFDVSNEFLFRSENNFYSKNVKMEVEKVFLRKSLDLSRFLHDMYSKIEEYEDFKFLSRQDFCYLINYFRNNSNRDVDINIVLEKIWNHFDFGENQEVFFLTLLCKNSPVSLSRR